MTIFIIIWGAVSLYLVIRSRYRLLCNELFWLCFFWTFIFGCFLSSGITYKKYGVSLQMAVFFVACIFSFLKGRKMGYLKNRSVYSYSSEQQGRGIILYTMLGLFGAFLFVYDFLNLNGIGSILARESGIKMNYEISILGSIGGLLVPILLVIGLYKIAFHLRFQGRFSIIGFVLLLLYTIPCILNSGRESLLYIIIGVLSLYGYKSIFKIEKKKKIGFKQVFSKTLLASVVIALFISIISISAERFDDTNVRLFLAENDVPTSTMKDAEKWGKMEFLYYNIASYFCHQVSMLDFTIREYDGPYLCGLYELNIISRRLPESLGLDYRQGSNKLRKLYSLKGVDFGGGWNTILGVFIIDFGRIGAIFSTFICGIVIGRVRRKFNETRDIKYAVLISLICLSAFSTIQMGPFYQILIYGSYIWWFIIFHQRKKKEKNYKLCL